MSLTGIPLLIIAALSSAGFATATLLLWSRFGRWRLLVRTVGVLVTEAAVVLSVGLAVNRSEEFYPSWAALGGDTGTESVAVTPRAGDLDATLAGRSKFVWHPRDLQRWHLTAAPTVTVPTGYLAGGSARYPVLITLRGTDTPVPAVPGVVTVTLTPSRATTGATLRTLITDLGRDVRVTPGGWAVVAEAGQAALAGQLARALPAQVRAIVVVQTLTPAGPAALGGTPPGTVLAVARPPAPPGRPDGSPPGMVTVTAAGPQVWQSAVGWATAQLSAPLTAPLLLPAGGTR